MPATNVKRRRISIHSTELATDVRRGIGSYGYCACGWEGPLRKTHGEARADAREHRHQEYKQ